MPASNLETEITQNDIFYRIKRYIIGIASILVVVPALINSAYDIYLVLYNIPTSQAEKTNMDFYAEYFDQKPIFKGELPLVTDDGKFTVALTLHGKGDLLVSYGNRSQWFPSPKSEHRVSMLPITSTYAEELQSEQYIQVESKKGNQLIQKQYYSDGKLQIITIDPKTGNLSKSQLKDYNNPPKSTPNATSSIEVYKYPEVDTRMDK
jgi:hypothetical protein